MMIFDELNKRNHYNIFLGDMVDYYRYVGGCSGDYIASLNKRPGMGEGKVYNPHQSNDRWKHTFVFHIR
ncbi:hypothetical protein FRX31_027047, partial [Thalictrum thalictroides]